MTAALSHHDKALLDAAAAADIMDAAGRMITDPRRARISQGELLAMSIALEGSQGALIEARLLLAALELPETGNDHDQAVKDHATAMQMHRLRAALAVLDGNTTDQEIDDGSSHT